VDAAALLGALRASLGRRRSRAAGRRALLVKERMSEFDGLGETEYLDLTNPQLH
jgi:hypothetical protein